MGYNCVIPEFRVSEISGTQGRQSRPAAAPGSRLSARARFGRDDSVGVPP
jgi:hypothetical protein